ncbi:MAG: YbhB/YbcL family Raf kinase inhibitor-like protein [Gammaproteobacteria bacterium]
MALMLRSSAYAHEDSIPARFTCTGEDISPPLEWSGVPEGTRSLVLIIDDPDAPDPKAPRMTWVHWVLYNIPPEATALPEDASRSGLPAGAMQGLNDWDKAVYGGPCPPIGRHRYVHKLYALDTILEGLERPVKADIGTAMQGHILEETKLVATYQK